MRMSDRVQAVDHDLLVRELNKVSQWDVLGIYLGLEENEIEEIERDHHDTARRRIVMLGKWMEKDVNASWEKVIEALKAMSQMRLASQLKEKYCTSESSPTTNTTTGHRVESSPEKELPVDRQESAIACEIQEYGVNYLSLVADANSAIADANPSERKLQWFSNYYMKTKVTSVDELFDQLNPLHFLDYALLEMMVKFFLPKTHEIANDLRDYVQQLARFKSSTTVRQFMESIESAQQSQSTTSERPGLCTIKLRLVGGWLEKTVEDLEMLVKEIFRDKVYVLSHLKIVRGSIIVTYCTPLSEVYYLLFFAWAHALVMPSFGVSFLAVGDITIVQSKTIFESSLVQSIIDNDLNQFSYLLNTDISIAERNLALMYASKFNRDKAVSLLLNANTNPNIQFTAARGETPLHVACESGHTGVVNILLKANADPNLQNLNGASPLFIASHNGYSGIVALLLKANADPNLHLGNGITPLYMASQNGHTDVVELLLKANANPNLQYDHVGSALCFASQNGHVGLITLLLEAKADPNLQRVDGLTPIYFACQEGHNDIVSVLLEAGANPNLGHQDGATPLYVASKEGFIEIVDLLLKAKADPNFQPANCETCLFIASLGGHINTVDHLLKANANPNLQRPDGSTPLIVASQEGHTKVVSLLLEADADTSLQQEDGITPLYIASQNGHYDTVSILLRANAKDTSNKNILTKMEEI